MLEKIALALLLVLLFGLAVSMERYVFDLCAASGNARAYCAAEHILGAH